jgi:hypothetical protein
MSKQFIEGNVKKGGINSPPTTPRPTPPPAAQGNKRGKFVTIEYINHRNERGAILLTFDKLKELYGIDDIAYFDRVKIDG